MNLSAAYRPNPLLSSSNPLAKTSHSQLPLSFGPRFSRQKPSFRVCCLANSNGSDGFSWRSLARSIRVASERFWSQFGRSVKRETGFDLDEANVRLKEFVGRVKDGVEKGEADLTRFRTVFVLEFVEWNRWELWKDVKNWEPQWIGAFVLYVSVAIISCQRIYVAILAPYLDHQRKELTEAYMDELIPEPSPSNIRKFKKGMWRKTMPKGLRLKKFIEGPDGTLVHDSTYVGEDAWTDDPEPSRENVKQAIDSNPRLSSEEKEKLAEDLGISGEVQANRGTWRERLHAWREIIKNEKFSEELDSSNAKYVVEFNMKEVENSLQEDVAGKVTGTQGARALWIAKRWWRYRPKLPYTYFLDKLDSSEVAAVVFTEDLKRLYVTMKDGFPLEYVVRSMTR